MSGRGDARQQFEALWLLSQLSLSMSFLNEWIQSELIAPNYALSRLVARWLPKVSTTRWKTTLAAQLQLSRFAEPTGLASRVFSWFVTADQPSEVSVLVDIARSQR